VKQSKNYKVNSSCHTSSTTSKSFLPSTTRLSRNYNWLVHAPSPICRKPQQNSSTIACDECADSIQLNVAGCGICNDHIENGNIFSRSITNPLYFDCLIAPWLYKTPLDILISKASGVLSDSLPFN
jgi:hypothetical protein